MAEGCWLWPDEAIFFLLKTGCGYCILLWDILFYYIVYIILMCLCLNRTFNVERIIKWVVKTYKVDFCWGGCWLWPDGAIFFFLLKTGCEYCILLWDILFYYIVYIILMCLCLNRTFNVERIVKWVVKIDKVDFWDAKCYIFWDPWCECS